MNLGHSGLMLLMTAGLQACAQKQYELEIRLISDGKQIAAPRLVVNEGEKSYVTEDSNTKKTEIQLTAKELNGKINLDVVLRTEESEGKNKTVQTGSFLLALSEGQNMSVNFSKDNSYAGSFISGFEVTARRAQVAFPDRGK
ncbi:MAG: hypothetical protein EBR09_00705 [Proteobacteria bacterium]|nr:hypothetical protein [Pseudomonadota bacterium]